MIVKTPKLNGRELAAVDQIWQLQQQIAPLVAESNRCTGALRRQALARAVKASNSIEGFEATLPQALELLINDDNDALDQKTKAALTGYRDAMTFVMQLAKDGRLTFDETFLKSCHFMITKDDLTLRPGRYRNAPVYVNDETTGQIVYEGADFELCALLVQETLDQANKAQDEFDIVAAAMVHLNMVLVHPFKDGNGRISRIMQSAVLARTDNRLSPVYLSIEEYLAAHTEKYYSVLASTAGSKFDPNVDARDWIRFCLEAHWQQAGAVRLNAQRTNQVWARTAATAEKLALNERAVGPLAFAASGNRLTNETYRALLAEAGDEVSALTATRDLVELVANGLLAPRGENRSREYLAGPTLQQLAHEVEIELDKNRLIPLF